jgi:putative chitinase
MQLYEKYKSLFGAYHINANLRIAHLMAQIQAECNLKSQRESCYYTSIKGLRATFYSPFKGKSDNFVGQYLKSSKKCANYVYANRGGNGNEASGDGFKYRGGGMLQVTFKDGYLRLSKDTRIDFMANPDIIIDEANGLISALNYWSKNNLNYFADLDDLDSISDIINKGHKTSVVGDANGYEHRKKHLINWKKTLGI